MKVAVMCYVIAEINKSLVVERKSKKTVSFLVHTCDGFFWRRSVCSVNDASWGLTIYIIKAVSKLAIKFVIEL